MKLDPVVGISEKRNSWKFQHNSMFHLWIMADQSLAHFTNLDPLVGKLIFWAWRCQKNKVKMKRMEKSWSDRKQILKHAFWNTVCPPVHPCIYLKPVLFKTHSLLFFFFIWVQWYLELKRLVRTEFWGKFYFAPKWSYISWKKKFISFSWK